VDLRPEQKAELARLLLEGRDVLELAFALEADYEKNHSVEAAQEFRHDKASEHAHRARAFAEGFALLMARTK
jgi:hypothetical protein